jgi:hypothetical protein
MSYEDFWFFIHGLNLTAKTKTERNDAEKIIRYTLRSIKTANPQPPKSMVAAMKRIKKRYHIELY